MVETWLPITDYEGFYEVSDHGRVRSLTRAIKCSNRTIRRKGKVLKPNYDTCGYAQVCLCDHTKRKTVSIHWLVAREFIGERPLGYDVCHNDGDKTNNHVSNLRYDTRSGNVKDNIRNGTHNWLIDGEIVPPTARIMRGKVMK